MSPERSFSAISRSCSGLSPGPPETPEGGAGVEVVRREGVDTPGYRFSTSLAEDLRRLEIVPVEVSEMRCLGTRAARSGRLGPPRPLPGIELRRSNPRDRSGGAPRRPAPRARSYPGARSRTSRPGSRAWLVRIRLRSPFPRPGKPVVATDGRHRPIRERALRLGQIGLFAITHGAGGSWQWPVGDVPQRRDRAPHRARTSLGWTWPGNGAHHGVRSVRFDVSGVGDSPVHAGQAENVPYSREWLDDLPALAKGVSPGDPSNTVLIGMCSGGYGAFESGMEIRARGVYVINPVLSSATISRSTEQYDPRRRAMPTASPSRWPSWPGSTAALRGGSGGSDRQFAVWQAPMAVPATAVRSGLDVVVICGADDLKPLREVLYWRAFGQRRLERTGTLPS